MKISNRSRQHDDIAGRLKIREDDLSHSCTSRLNAARHVCDRVAAFAPTFPFDDIQCSARGGKGILAASVGMGVGETAG
jgi:hypothetical protein